MQWLGLIKEIVIRLADEGDIELALQTVRSLPIEMTIADQITPVEMLVHIASLMPDTYRKEVVREAYDRACSIHANDDRVRALSLLLPYFSKDLWIQLRQEVLFNLKTMNLAQWIEYMPLEVRDKIALDVFDVAITMKDGRQQANAMKELIRYLSGLQRRRAIRIISQSVQDSWPKSRHSNEHDGVLDAVH